MNILVLNAGSSSVKFQLIGTDASAIATDGERRLARGQVERIGGEAILTLAAADGAAIKTTAPIRDLTAAVEHIIAWLVSDASGVSIGSVGDVEAVGHRVVHGGERFTHSTRVDDTVRKELEDLIELAPLHNPHNIRGITAATAALGASVPQVAVFDTAFHHSLPETAYIYAIPYQLYRRHRVRATAFTAPHTATSRIDTGSSPAPRAPTRRSSPSTSAMARPRAPSRVASRSIPRWASRRSKAS